ncbi:hypothetical protein A33M_4425 [Rhodovulum sp. PH10]|uniref:hypothetical protein n=1 Tax=Rhodovulum sp. PH10 TaxID=1187851 RepID=UPI00027C2E51|nr:hypothetical protein [Rhodovulum sp. PH10]EJW10449.1 hypothetical protein A33M_4425 [Rhodovulum sp. PH10]
MSISSFNWVSTPTAFQQVSNWNEKQKAYRANAEANLAAMSDSFASATLSLSNGLAEIAANQLAARVSSQLNQKISQAQNQLDLSV